MVGGGGRKLTATGEEQILAGRRREYDEDDVRVRPRRSSRPRTRTRPAHDDAVDGFVVTVDRGRYGCVLTGPQAPQPVADPPPVVTAMRARELGRRAVVVGDRVALVGDVSGDAGSLARIVRIDERASVLRRTADDDETTPEGRLERVVVANADQLVIVSALADPPPRTGFIDRCLVAAFDAGIDPLLCLTKADLADPAPVVDYYRDLDLEYVLCRPGSDLADLRHRLAGRLSVLVGHSGVGKSTLVNRLVPEALRAVGTVSAIGRGRHTSSSAVALRLPYSGASPDGADVGGRADGAGASADGAGAGSRADARVVPAGDPGWIVDTPGVRSFGLAHVSAESLLHGFADLVEGSLDCPPNCEHTGDAGQCRLAGWVAAGNADPRRLASYRRLLDSRSGDTETGRTATRE